MDKKYLQGLKNLRKNILNGLEEKRILEKRFTKSPPKTRKQKRRFLGRGMFF
jgi:hypothetical protein